MNEEVGRRSRPTPPVCHNPAKNTTARHSLPVKPIAVPFVWPLRTGDYRIRPASLRTGVKDVLTRAALHGLQNIYATPRISRKVFVR
jgi:hypothetical protein